MHLFFKKSKIFLASAIIFLTFIFLPVVVNAQNFGYTTQGSSSVTLRDTIRGSWFISPENGTADSITLYYVKAGYSKPVKAAIYTYVADNDAGVLLGTTTESSISSSGWRTFSFPDPKPTLSAGTKYFLVAWSGGYEGTEDLAYDTELNKGISLSLGYGNFPTTLTGESGTNFKHSIYLNYTPGTTTDTTSPALSNASPAAGTVLAAGTTQTTISLTATDSTPPISCRYSTTPNTPYSSMTGILTNTGGDTYSATVTGLSNGNTYDYYVRCQDSASLPNANTADFSISFSVASPAPPDTSPPVISNVQSSGITVNSAAITWATDDLSTSIVNYGLTTSFGQTQSNSNLVANHSINLTGLSSNTTYYYQVRSCNSDNYCSVSATANFTTPAPPTGGSTTVGTLQLIPTFESIGVYSNFSGDNNQNNNTLLEYRQTGSSQWISATQMVVDRRAQVVDGSGTITNPYAYQWRASMVGLARNTTYDVSVTYTDSDGVTGSPVVGNVTTWGHDQAPSSGNTFYVVSAGNDTNPGTEASPWLTLQKAANTVSPGDTVLVKPGNYTGFTISRSGTLTNYVTFQSFDPNNKAVITTYPTLNANYIRLKEFLFQDGISISNGRFDILEESEIINKGTVLNNDVTGTLIQNNNIRNITANGPGGWESSGIYILPTATGGVVIRNNNFTGPCWDAIGGGSNFYIAGGFQDTDIYNNYISGCSDDGIETEGGQINVRIWSNTLVNSGGNADLGLASIIVGPTYVFRNVVIWKTSSSQNIFKLGGGQSITGNLFIYHNTVYSNNSRQGFTDAGGRSANNINNIVSRNNILQIGNRVIAAWGSPSSFADTNSFNYDNLYKPPGGYGDSYAVWDGGYYNFAEFRAGKPNQEINGISAVSQFADVANNNFRLQSTSPEIDKGVVIVGFNDTNSPWPYRGTASDIGAFEYDSGAPVDITPPARSNAQPSGILAPGTTQATLSLSTNESAACRYSTTAGTAYGSMTNTLSTTGGTSHSTTVSGLADGNTYNYYIRCQDTAGNANNNDYTISFLVTLLGDISSQTAGQRDGLVNIYDVSRLLSKWGSTLPADLAEADINAGPNNVSQGRIDLYDANLMMKNWRP